MGRVANNITGETFGKLTAIKYLGDSIWECKCECGNTKNVRYTDLKIGRITTCGKCTKTATLKEDLTDKVFNNWKVRKYLGNSMWECECSCGEIREVNQYDLKNNKSKSCGHNITGPRFIDITGETFGKWTVLSYAGNKQWNCRCSCGKEKVVWGKYLRSGQSKSCGHSELYDMIGQRFGKLILLEPKGDCKWLCRCDCNNLTIVNSNNLWRGATKSCGCESASRPKYNKEDIISKLNEIEIDLNRKPYIDELCYYLDISIGTGYEYLSKYSLHSLVNRHYTESKVERDIANLLECNYEAHNREILNGKELDIYIPDKKIAIEVNGDYWHSELYQDSSSHQLKTLMCAKSGIRLIHIFEHELSDDKRDVIVSYIKEKVNNDYEVIDNVDNYYIKEIEKDIAIKFLEKYCLSKYKIESNKYIGYFDNGILLGLVVISDINKSECCIANICWCPGIKVINGTHSLLSYVQNNLNIKTLRYENDITKFTGKSLIEYGFKVKDITEPKYKWFNPYSKNTPIIDGCDTYDEKMYGLGYYKIYDSGSMVLEYRH